MNASLAALSCLVALGSLPTDKALDARLEQVAQARVACGPRAVWYSLRRLGHDADLEEVCKQTHLQTDGTSLADLLRTLRYYDVPAQAIVCDPLAIPSLPVPSILVLGRRHSVVFDGLEPDGQTVRYYEPAEGRVRTAPLPAVQRSFSGEVIIFEPMPITFAAFCALAVLGMVGTLGLAFVGSRFLKCVLTWRGHALLAAEPGSRTG